MDAVNVIVWDEAEKRRKVVPTRWGFPHPKNWRIPQPIHARSEAMDELKTFKVPFLAGRRGIVPLMRGSRSPRRRRSNGRLILSPRT
jgi:putative SOS response-associated peptidase YedK